MQSVVTFCALSSASLFQDAKGGTMARAESKATAKVESGWLYHDGDEGAIQIGDSRWYRWLQLGKTFYYTEQDGGRFTRRSEERHLIAHDYLIANYVCASGKHYPYTREVRVAPCRL
jgi:hypothetical protein